MKKDQLEAPKRINNVFISLVFLTSVIVVFSFILPFLVELSNSTVCLQTELACKLAEENSNEFTKVEPK